MKAYVLVVTIFLFPALGWGFPFSEGVLERKEVKNALHRFTGIERGFIQRGLDNSARYLPWVVERVRERNLPEELAYLPLIESGYSVRAFSRAGAAGIWQFMVPTARHYGLRVDFWVDERRDPFKSTEAALRHLQDLYRYFDDWELALAAYNAGLGAVRNAVRRGDSSDYWELCRNHLLKRETRDYVPRFIASAYIAEHPKKFGFSVKRGREYPQFEVLTVEKPIDLTIFSKRSGIRLEELRLLNPELSRLMTPPGRSYDIRIPEDNLDVALSTYHDLPAEELIGVSRYSVHYGETLSSIAQRYGTTVTLLKLINNIRNPRRVFAGKTIFVPVKNGKNITEVTDAVPVKDHDTQEIRYTVRKGDTVWDIARRFGSDIETVLAVNGMSFNSVLMPGEEIVLWIETAYRR